MASKNGPDGFRRLWQHYLGPNNVNHMATEARAKLTSTTYSGEKSRWNWEKYVRTHVEQHTILSGLIRYGYSGIDERTKVQYLMDGIKTKELEAVKSTILADDAKQTDFSACVNLYQSYIKQNKTLNPPRIQVAAVQAGTGKRNNKRKVEDRYYAKDEYKRLTKEQRD
jgi:hypothetical protein